MPTDPDPDPVLTAADVDPDEGGEGPCLAEVVDDHRDAPAATERPQGPEGDPPQGSA